MSSKSAIFFIDLLNICKFQDEMQKISHYACPILPEANCPTQYTPLRYSWTDSNQMIFALLWTKLLKVSKHKH